MIAILMTLVLAQDDLDEVRNLMLESERLLNDLRAGASLPKQEEILRRLERMIEQARASSSSKPGEERSGRSARNAERSYEPERKSEPSSRYESRAARGSGWGDLHPRVRQAILQSERDLDKYPPGLRERMMKYFEELAKP